MYAPRDTYFGRTSRRAPLGVAGPLDVGIKPAGIEPAGIEPGAALDPEPSGVTLDRILPGSLLHGRLVAYHDADDQRDYVALAVGEVRGENDVPVRAVEEECLVVAAARSSVSEILVGTDDGELDAREIDRQLRLGGPVRDLLEYTGVRSVVVDYLDVPTA